MKQTFWLQDRNAGIWEEVTRETYVETSERLFTCYPHITEYDQDFITGKWKGFVWPPLGSITLEDRATAQNGGSR